MSPTEVLVIAIIAMLVGSLIGVRFLRWVSSELPPYPRTPIVRGDAHECANCGPDVDWSFGDDKAANPHVPPMTATWPARWIEENGFRYVLDLCEQWRPFETAPCDGTEILVWRSDAGVFMAHFTLSADGESEDWFTTAGENLPGDELPTRWMPIPMPPKDTCNEKEQGR